MPRCSHNANYTNCRKSTMGVPRSAAIAAAAWLVIFQPKPPRRQPGRGRGARPKAPRRRERSGGSPAARGPGTYRGRRARQPPMRGPSRSGRAPPGPARGATAVKPREGEELQYGGTRLVGDHTSSRWPSESHAPPRRPASCAPTTLRPGSANCGPAPERGAFFFSITFYVCRGRSPHPDRALLGGAADGVRLRNLDATPKPPPTTV